MSMVSHSISLNSPTKSTLIVIYIIDKFITCKWADIKQYENKIKKLAKRKKFQQKKLRILFNKIIFYLIVL